MYNIVRVSGGLGNQLFCFAKANSLNLNNTLFDVVTSYRKDKYGRKVIHQLFNDRLASKLQSKTCQFLGYCKDPAVDYTFKVFNNKYHLGYWINVSYITDSVIREVIRRMPELVPSKAELEHFSHIDIAHYRDYEIDDKSAQNIMMPTKFAQFANYQIISNNEEFNSLSTYSKDDLADFRAMVASRSLVISNSTYSLWAAYIKQFLYPNNKVYFYNKVLTGIGEWQPRKLVRDQWIGYG